MSCVRTSSELLVLVLFAAVDVVLVAVLLTAACFMAALTSDAIELSKSEADETADIDTIGLLSES
jgi:hypothetical protein